MSKGAILMGNNTFCKIVCIGTIKIKMFDGVVIKLNDVRHVPNLKRSLISTIDSKGNEYTGEGGVVKINNSYLVVMKGHIKLYVF